MDKSGTILLTGGTKGIGFASAKEMVSLGYRNFILGYHKSDSAATVAKTELEQTEGVKIVLVKGDVSDSSTIDRYFTTVDGEFGGSLYAIAHTAGKYLPKGEKETLFNEYQEMYTKAFWRLIDKGLPYLEKSANGGRILTLSTPGCNLMAHPRLSYFLPGCAKASLEYMVRHYALLLAPKRITCNVVIPGITETDAWSTATPPIDPVKLAEQRCPMKAVIAPSDVGAAVAFLLSDKAKFITGTMLPVDGGLMFV